MRWAGRGGRRTGNVFAAGRRWADRVNALDRTRIALAVLLALGMAVATAGPAAAGHDGGDFSTPCHADEVEGMLVVYCCVRVAGWHSCPGVGVWTP